MSAAELVWKESSMPSIHRAALCLKLHEPVPDGRAFFGRRGDMAWTNMIRFPAGPAVAARA
jgi:hypothetical protein